MERRCHILRLAVAYSLNSSCIRELEPPSFPPLNQRSAKKHFLGLGQLSDNIVVALRYVTLGVVLGVPGSGSQCWGEPQLKAGTMICARQSNPRDVPRMQPSGNDIKPSKPTPKEPPPKAASASAARAKGLVERDVGQAQEAAGKLREVGGSHLQSEIVSCSIII